MPTSIDPHTAPETMSTFSLPKNTPPQQLSQIQRHFDFEKYR